MTDYQIVCVTTEHPHQHITNAGTVGVGTDPTLYSNYWTVQEVRAAIDRGDTFHTISPTTGDRAEVYPDDCGTGGCGVKTIRSRADNDADNNLDNLRTCNPPN